MSVFDLALLGPEAERLAAPRALALAGRGFAPAIVISDAEGRAIGLPATGAARRIAAGLAADGVPACTRGRLAWVRPTRDELVRVARRVAARTQVPVVLALARPRDEAADVLLAESLRVLLIAEPDGPVAVLALAQLATIGVLAESHAPVDGPAAALARLGWGPAPASWLAARPLAS